MYKPLRWKLWIVLFLWLASCSPVEVTSTPRPKLGLPPTQIPPLQDDELSEAIRQAQETLYIWRHEVLAPTKSYSMSSLKVRFTGVDGSVEDMWTEPVIVLDDRYTVRMIEGVTLDKGIHPDRILDVTSQDIVDWMLLEKDGTVIGGYTLRLEYNRMTPEEQKKYREVTGYKFE